MFLFDHLPKPTLKHKDKSDLTQEEKYYLKLFYPHLKDPMKESNGSVTGDITPDIVTKKTKKKEPDPNLRDKLLSEYYKNLRSRQEKTDIDLKLINAYKQILEQHLNPT